MDWPTSLIVRSSRSWTVDRRKSATSTQNGRVLDPRTDRTGVPIDAASLAANVQATAANSAALWAGIRLLLTSVL